MLDSLRSPNSEVLFCRMFSGKTLWGKCWHWCVGLSSCQYHFAVRMLFEVSDTLATSGTWDHSIGNCWGPYGRGFRTRGSAWLRTTFRVRHTCTLWHAFSPFAAVFNEVQVSHVHWGMCHRSQVGQKHKRSFSNPCFFEDADRTAAVDPKISFATHLEACQTDLQAADALRLQPGGGAWGGGVFGNAWSHNRT